MGFREFINEQNTVGKHNDYAMGAFLSRDFSGSDTADQMVGRQPYLFGTDLLPTAKRTGKIVVFRDNTNPVYIQLSDGTNIVLKYDEFKRAFPNYPEEPVSGQDVTVYFQRFPGDTREEPSQIQSISLGPKPPNGRPLARRWQ